MPTRRRQSRADKEVAEMTRAIAVMADRAVARRSEVLLPMIRRRVQASVRQAAEAGRLLIEAKRACQQEGQRERAHSEASGCPAEICGEFFRAPDYEGGPEADRRDAEDPVHGRVARAIWTPARVFAP